MSRISSSSSGGAVKIQDSSGNNISATDGAINVNVVSTTPSIPQTTLSLYYQIDNIAQGGIGTVLTYTVPPGVSLYLNKILISSDSISQFDLQLNSITNARKRVSYTVFNEVFDYSLNGNIGGYKIESGTIITLVATNLSTGGTASFNATLQGVQE